MKKNSIFCSSLNSDLSEAPDWESAFTPIQKFTKKKENAPKVNEAKSNIDERTVLQTSYTKYLQDIYTFIMMNDQFSEEKSEIETYITSLSKELEEQRKMLKKANTCLKDILYSSEIEAVLKSRNSGIANVSSVLEDLHMKDLEIIIGKLNSISSILYTKNIKVPKGSCEKEEFQKIMVETLTRLKMLNEAIRPYADSYAQAGNLLQSILDSQDIIANEVQRVQHLISALQEKLLPYVSKKKSEMLDAVLAGVGDDDENENLRILKQFSEELKGQN